MAIYSIKYFAANLYPKLLQLKTSHKKCLVLAEVIRSLNIIIINMIKIENEQLISRSIFSCRVLATVLLSIFLLGAQCKAFSKSMGKSIDTISISSLLDELVNTESDPCYPSPLYTSKLETSHDRRSVIPGTPSWHANNDASGFIRYEANNGRVEKVLFDQAGPGVITRIITTGKAVGANLRIYFDDASEASIIIPTYDIAQFPVNIPGALLYKHEHYATTQGCSFYYPVPYSKRCKITVDDLDRDYYFHANYRTYPQGTVVKTFSIADANALQTKASEVGHKLQNPISFTDNGTLTRKKIKPNSTLSLKLPQGSKAIRTLNFKISDYNQTEYGQLMRGLIVKIYFDGKQTVWVPLSDFSGAGMGAPKVDSYYLSADGFGNITVRFVMPYQSNARVDLENITKYTVTALIKVNISDWKWNDNTLYFHASWRQQRGLMTNKGLDYTNATLTGRGVFKGDVLSLYNYTKRWYGEGDEHIWIDNEKYPSHFGCGTEDYYNTTFAPIHPYFLPFGGAPREDDVESRGYNTFVRTRNLDVIPFDEKLKFEFELLSWDGGLVDYSSTVYWYGDIDSKAINPSSNEEALYVLPPAIYTNSYKN